MAPGAACDCPRAGELQFGNRLVVGDQAGDQDAKIEAGVVCHQAIGPDLLGNLRPQFSEFGFTADLLRCDAVNLDVGSVEVKRFGPDQPAGLIDDAALAHGHQSQLTGAVASSAGRFEIDGGEIRSKVHLIDPRHWNLGGLPFHAFVCAEPLFSGAGGF